MPPAPEGRQRDPHGAAPLTSGRSRGARSASDRLSHRDRHVVLAAARERELDQPPRGRKRRSCRRDGADLGGNERRDPVDALGKAVRREHDPVADLEGAENIEASHLSEAIQYRTLDRNLIS